MHGVEQDVQQLMRRDISSALVFRHDDVIGVFGGGEVLLDIGDSRWAVGTEQPIARHVVNVNEADLVGSTLRILSYPVEHCHGFVGYRGALINIKASGAQIDSSVGVIELHDGFITDGGNSDYLSLLGNSDYLSLFTR